MTSAPAATNHPPSWLAPALLEPGESSVEHGHHHTLSAPHYGMSVMWLAGLRSDSTIARFVDSFLLLALLQKGSLIHYIFSRWHQFVCNSEKHCRVERLFGSARLKLVQLPTTSLLPTLPFLRHVMVICICSSHFSLAPLLVTPSCIVALQCVCAPLFLLSTQVPLNALFVQMSLGSSHLPHYPRHSHAAWVC